MADKKIRIHIGSGFDPSGVRQASKTLDSFNAKLMDSNKMLLQVNAELSAKMHNLAQSIAVDFGAAADKTAKGLGRVYETLDQINARIDLPKKMAREQEELNRALKRYCELCEEARRREQARIDSWKSPKNQWNQGAGAGILHGLGGSGGSGGSSGTAGQIADVKHISKSVVPALIAIDRMAGGLDDNLGKVARGMQSIIGLSAAFGPLGAVVGGAFAAIDVAASAYVESQQRAIQKLTEMSAAIGEHWKAVKEAHFEKVAKDVDSVAESAKRSAEFFELAAEKRAAFNEVRKGMDAAIAQTELLKMQRDMSVDVSQADEGNKGRVAAAWKLLIAEKEVELRERAANIEAANDRESLETAEKRLSLAQSRMNNLAAAEDRARAEYQRVRDIYVANDGKAGEKNADVEHLKGVYENARKRTREAAKEYDKSQAELEVLQKQAEVAAIERQNAVMQAHNAAESASSDYNKAERDFAIAAAKAAAQERDRLDRELHAKRMADLRAEIAAQKDAASQRQAVAAAAQSEFERAFAMYRDPTRAAAEIEEERDRAADLKQLHKDASRYGGKWRIDELSALMSAGDTQGVSSRLEDWRKSRSFTPEVEAMVRASAAEQTRTTVEDELRKIETNTAGLAEKLDELLMMKGS